MNQKKGPMSVEVMAIEDKGQKTSAIKRVKEDQGLDIATQEKSRQRQQDFPFSTPSLPFAHDNNNPAVNPFTMISLFRSISKLK
jgi:hypothetical protein